MDARETEMAVLVVVVAILTCTVVALTQTHISEAEAITAAATGVIGAALARLFTLVRATNGTKPMDK